MRLFDCIRGWTYRAGRLSQQLQRPRPAIRLACERLEDRIGPALGNPIAAIGDPGHVPDEFGYSVALTGGNVLVGAPFAYSGSGAVYRYNPAGILLDLVNTIGGASPVGELGYSVAASNDNAFFASPTAGSVASYYDNSVINDPDQAAGDRFGNSIAASDQYVLVGAPGVNGNAGAAFLFDFAGHDQTLSDPNSGDADNFGRSVAVSDQYVLVGAPATSSGAGAAYLFDTAGNLLQTFNDPSGSPKDSFGGSVALSGQNLVVGAPGANGGAGAAYLYDTSGNLLETYHSTADGAFGTAIAMSGSDLLVGARDTACLFDTAGNLVQSFTDPTDLSYDSFGHAVALSGSYALIGTPYVNGGDGAVYLYTIAAAQTALAGSHETTPVGTAFGTALETQVIDAQGDPVSGANVVFTVNNGAGGAGATFPGGATDVTVTTNGQGVAYAPPLTANSMAGAFTVTAKVGSITSTFSLSNTAGAPATIAVAGGSGQYDIVGTAYAQPLQALVTDADGNPVASVPVTFTTPSSGPGGTFYGMATALTDAQGVATAPAFIANHSQGSYQVAAAVPGVALPIDFALTNIAAPAAAAITSGNNQTAIVYSTYARRLAVTVTDAYTRPIHDLAVEFDVIPTGGDYGAGGTFNGATTATVLTNAGGTATAPALVADSGMGSFTIEAWILGMVKPLAFTLSNSSGAAARVIAVSGTPQSATAGTKYASRLQVEVVTQGGKPITNATVKFTVVPSGGAGAGFGSSNSLAATAITDPTFATAPPLTANGTAGSFTVTASVPGLAALATFKLANTIAPARIVAVAGTTPQSVSAGQPFPTDLAVQVFDSHGHPISGAVVTFTVPVGSLLVPPPATFPGGDTTALVSTGRTGTATAPRLTSSKSWSGNTVTVQATVAGLSTVVTFDLTIQ
jgi:hypothetical protein